jgi:hypothetical protein
MNEKYETETISYKDRIGYFARLKNDRLVNLYAPPRPDARERIEQENPALPVLIRRSDSTGQELSQATEAFNLPAGMGVCSNPFPLVSPDGTLHVFVIRFYKLGGDWAEESRSHAVMLHYASKDDGKTWDGPHDVDFGKNYTGSLNSVIALQDGRLILPLSCPSDAFQGRSVCVTTVSDDNGDNWKPGGQEIIVPDGDQPGHPGALEPVILELSDGRIWMIIRTQTGYFYETFSEDRGMSWTSPVKTGIQAPNAPASLCRLGDGSILMSWNDLGSYPDDPGGSRRQYLHVARSTDEGRNFGPAIEVARRRSGDAWDTNVAYPYLTPIADGGALLLYHRVGSDPDATWWVPILEVVKLEIASFTM